MNLQTSLDAARAVGPLLGGVPAVAAVIDHAVKALSDDDQATAKETLAELRAGNDDLHDRLQQKLGDAAGR